MLEIYVFFIMNEDRFPKNIAMSYSKVPLSFSKRLLRFPSRNPTSTSQSLKYMGYFASQGSVSNVSRWFDHLRAINGEKMRVESWELYLEAASKDSCKDTLDTLYQAINKAEVTPTIKMWRLLVRGFAGTGDLGRSKEIFDEMLQSGVTPPESVVDTMRDALQKAGEQDIYVTTITEHYGMINEPGWKQEESEQEARNRDYDFS